MGLVEHGPGDECDGLLVRGGPGGEGIQGRHPPPSVIPPARLPVRDELREAPRDVVPQPMTYGRRDPGVPTFELGGLVGLAERGRELGLMLRVRRIRVCSTAHKVAVASFGF